VIFVSVVKERYVVDAEGNRIAVLLDLDDYERLLEAFEELEAIRAYDAAKASGDEAIPFDEAVREIERQRNR
jgi:PHD/YefM family antitoxin component YafN of YafNO toxin-antitoxin module